MDYGARKKDMSAKTLRGVIRNGPLENMSSKGNIINSLVTEKLGDIVTYKSIPGKQDSL